MTLEGNEPAVADNTSTSHHHSSLRVGILGFGGFGEFLARKLLKAGHQIFATNYHDRRDAAKALGVTYYDWDDMRSFITGSPDSDEPQIDVLLISVSILSFEMVVRNMAKDGLMPLLADVVVAEVLSIKTMPRRILLDLLPPTTGILCTHPMFGAVSGSTSWEGLPFLYDVIRDGETSGAKVKEATLCFLDFWEDEGCKMVPMSCEQHDVYAADSQFITHLTSRILDTQHLKPTPIDTKSFESMLRVVDTSCKSSLDLFYGLYRYNPAAKERLAELEKGLDEVKKMLDESSPEPAVKVPAVGRG